MLFHDVPDVSDIVALRVTTRRIVMVGIERLAVIRPLAFPSSSRSTRTFVSAYSESGRNSLSSVASSEVFAIRP